MSKVVSSSAGEKDEKLDVVVFPFSRIGERDSPDHFFNKSPKSFYFRERTPTAERVGRPTYSRH